MVTLQICHPGRLDEGACPPGLAVEACIGIVEKEEDKVRVVVVVEAVEGRHGEESQWFEGDHSCSDH